jgi:hypothetical protein
MSSRRMVVLFLLSRVVEWRKGGRRVTVIFVKLNNRTTLVNSDDEVDCQSSEQRLFVRVTPAITRLTVMSTT